jgi:uncharacterized membrane protein YfcA
VGLLVFLFAISWLAATISGAAGFGGALLLLPVLTQILGVKAAVPVLAIMQLLGNLSRVWFGRTQIAWKPAGLFLLGAIPLAILGSVLFTALPTRLITRGIGVLLLLIVIAQQYGLTTFTTTSRGLLAGGAVTGLLSGVAGSAGPLGAAIFLGLDLPAVAYVASEAVTASAMHLTKMAVYQRYALIGLRELQYGLFLGIAMILGSWTGKRLIERLPKATFRRVVTLLLVLSALQLIVFA